LQLQEKHAAVITRPRSRLVNNSRAQSGSFVQPGCRALPEAIGVSPESRVLREKHEGGSYPCYSRATLERIRREAHQTRKSCFKRRAPLRSETPPDYALAHAEDSLSSSHSLVKLPHRSCITTSFLFLNLANDGFSYLLESPARCTLN
jgi:hypothetical protein